MNLTTSQIILQSRDLAVLTSLGEHGLLDTDMIHARHFASVSRRRCLQRLAGYQQQGLTRTVHMNVWNGACSQKAPVVYLLSERGAEVLETHTGSRPKRVSRSDPKPETVHHRLQIIQTRLVFDDACSAMKLTPPLWIMEQDRDPAASDQLPPSQRRVLYHGFPKPFPACTCQPDAAFRFSVPLDPASLFSRHADLVSFFEIDCSTEGRKQIKTKLPGYERLLSQKSYLRYFAESEKATIRIFWVCPTWERVRSLCQVLKDEPVAKFFRFTALQGMKPTTVLTDPIWQDTQGKRREIVSNHSANPIVPTTMYGVQP